MLMVDTQIRELVAQKHLIIENFEEQCLQATSYDVRAGAEVFVSHNERSARLDEIHAVALRPGEFALLISHERFKLPMDVAANIGAKTHFTRKGLILLAGLQIDPGFEGALALAVCNSSPRSIVIEYLQKICTVQFFKLEKPATKQPPLNEDLLAGHLPRVDKDFFRELETESLTELGRELRRLAADVDQLTRNVTALSENTHRILWPMAIGVMVAILTLAFGVFAKILF